MDEEVHQDVPKLVLAVFGKGFPQRHGGLSNEEGPMSVCLLYVRMGQHDG